METAENEPKEADDIKDALADFGFDLGEDDDLKIEHELDDLTKTADDSSSGLDFDLSDIHGELEKLTAEDSGTSTVSGDDSIVDFDLGELESDLDDVLKAEPATAMAQAEEDLLPETEAIDGMLDELAEEEPLIDFESDGLFELTDHEPDLLNDVDEVGTKLDLAKAYIDMGDPDGARSILQEVLAEGSEQQVQDANELLAQI
jgi:pilus assembly protein FimV